MANLALFNTRPAAASVPRPPVADTRNEAGGLAYALSPEAALAQYAVTGCFGHTFYADADQQLDRVLALAGQVSPRFVAQTAVYAREHGAMKDVPALLVAALTTLEPALARQVFHRVVDNGRMVRNFVQIIRSGVVGRRSLGSLPKRLVCEWLERRTDRQLFEASVGQQPSLADIVKMVHPRPATPAREALYAWLIGRTHDAAQLPEIVREFEAFKADPTRAANVPDVPFQMLTALPLGPEGWTAIARRAPWTMTRMNLNTFARHEVFTQPGLTRRIAERLADAELVRKARAFPYQLLAAAKNAGPGVPEPVPAALETAMEHATANVPRFPGSVVVCPDVSGSMHSPVTGHRPGATSKVRCLDVAALMAATVLRRNPDATVLPFKEDVVDGLRLNPRDTITTNADKLAALPPGGTNCSAPLRRLNERDVRADLVILFSDNESWMDSPLHGRTAGSSATETMREWTRFRHRNPAARLVCVDLQPYATTQASERADILNVGGFADSVFELIARFANGELEAGHWVTQIAAIEI